MNFYAIWEYLTKIQVRDPELAQRLKRMDIYEFLRRKQEIDEQALENDIKEFIQSLDKK